jgi:hypothetical protein
MLHSSKCTASIFCSRIFLSDGRFDMLAQG